MIRVGKTVKVGQVDEGDLRSLEWKADEAARAAERVPTIDGYLAKSLERVSFAHHKVREMKWQGETMLAHMTDAGDRAMLYDMFGESRQIIVDVMSNMRHACAMRDLLDSGLGQVSHRLSWLLSNADIIDICLMFERKREVSNLIMQAKQQRRALQKACNKIRNIDLVRADCGKHHDALRQIILVDDLALKSIEHHEPFRANFLKMYETASRAIDAAGSELVNAFSKGQ